MTRYLSTALFALSAFSPSQVLAHHSLAAFDLGAEMTFEGVIARFDWANPHVYVQIERSLQDGTKEIWSIEAQAIAGMAREGWTSTSLTPGERVRIVANPPRDASRRIALGTTIVKQNGTALFIPRLNTIDRISTGGSDTFVADSLAGRWVPRWNPDVGGGFLDPRSAWSLTESAIEAVDAFTSEMNPAANCVPAPIPYRMIFPLPITIQIGDEAVLLRYETGDTRTVHMHADSHDTVPYADFGHSVGVWDDDALVVDTQRFLANRSGNAATRGVPSSRDKHLVERFELSDDGTFMRYTFRLEDPQYLQEPVTGTLELAYRPDFEFDYSPCDLDSAQRYLRE